MTELWDTLDQLDRQAQQDRQELQASQDQQGSLDRGLLVRLAHRALDRLVQRAQLAERARLAQRE